MKRKPITYTPGPWQADRNQIRNPDGWALGSYPYNLGDETDHNNGRLMAAAPALLEACIEVLDILENITTEQFTTGGDKRARAILEEAIAPLITPAKTLEFENQAGDRVTVNLDRDNMTVTQKEKGTK